MIESVDRNASWDPHVLSCRPPPWKGQGEEEGNGAGHDGDDDYDDDDNDDDEECDKSGVGDNRIKWWRNLSTGHIDSIRSINSQSDNCDRFLFGNVVGFSNVVHGNHNPVL